MVNDRSLIFIIEKQNIRFQRKIVLTQTEHSSQYIDSILCCVVDLIQGFAPKENLSRQCTIISNRGSRYTEDG